MSKDKEEQQIFDFITNAFEANRYNDVRDLLELFKQDTQEEISKGYANKNSNNMEERMQKALDNILCFDNYSVIKWTAEEINTEGLLLLQKYLSKKELFNAIADNNFEAIRLFISNAYVADVLGKYEPEVFKKGLGVFLTSYLENPDSNKDIKAIISNDIKNLLVRREKLGGDFMEELATLKEASILSEQQLEEALTILGQDSIGFVSE